MSIPLYLSLLPGTSEHAASLHDPVSIVDRIAQIRKRKIQVMTMILQGNQCLKRLREDKELLRWGYADAVVQKRRTITRGIAKVEEKMEGLEVELNTLKSDMDGLMGGLKENERVR